MSTSEYSDFVALTEDRGVLKKVINEGNPNLKPMKGDTVYVHYTGTYVGGENDGKVFDSSLKRNEQFSFCLGKQDVISSWDIAVATMGIGEKCLLIASPEYGYKDGETRKFEIELFDFVGEDVSLAKDKSVTKSLLKEGDSASSPLVGTEITVEFKISGSNDTPKSVSYTLGDPADQSVPYGIDVALRSMHLHESSRVKFKNSEPSGDSSPFLMYDVVLKSHEKIRRLNSFDTFPEKMKYADDLKKRAATHFTSKKFNLGLEIYRRLHEDCLYLVTATSEEENQLKAFKVINSTNMAQCYLVMKDTVSCIENCEKALEINPKHVKAIFKIGLAKQMEKDDEEACKYFQMVLDIEKDNSAAVKKLIESKSNVYKQKQVEKKRFRNIFKNLGETGLGIEEPEPTPEAKKMSDSEDDDDEGEEEEASGKDVPVDLMA